LFWTQNCRANVGVCCKSVCLSCKRLQTGKEDITTTSIIQVKIYQTQIYGRLLLLELAQLMLIAVCQIHWPSCTNTGLCVFGAKTGKEYVLFILTSTNPICTVPVYCCHVSLAERQKINYLRYDNEQLYCGITVHA